MHTLAAMGSYTASKPLVITIRRIGPRMLDTDNAARAAKSVRDGIADAVGIDDGDPGLTWRYEQRRATAGAAGADRYGVEIEITIGNGA